MPLVVEPDPDNPGCACVWVDATVDGRSYRFLLDSGAARTQMRSDAWIDVLPSDVRHESSGVFATTSEDIIVLSSIRIGSLIVTDVQAARAAAGENLLAMDVLGQAAIRIDLDHAELTIEASGTASTPWTLDRGPYGHPFLGLEWPGVTGRRCLTREPVFPWSIPGSCARTRICSPTPQRPRARTRAVSRGCSTCMRWLL